MAEQEYIAVAPVVIQVVVVIITSSSNRRSNKERERQATYPSEFRLDWCVGEHCFDHSISAAQFQMRLKGYYQDRSRQDCSKGGRVFWKIFLGWTQ